jgi:transposase-like protein
MTYDRTEWPGHVLADRSVDSFIRRMTHNENTLTEKGKFDSGAVMKALVNPEPETKEAVSTWLIEELGRLREGERVAGQAPARRGETLSRIQIADIAMTMIECLDHSIGEKLICLLQALLDIDRHRLAFSKQQSREFEIAAAIEGQASAKGRLFGVREIARAVGVNPSTISAWRRDQKYKQDVGFWKKMILEPEFRLDVRKRPEHRSKR